MSFDIFQNIMTASDPAGGRAIKVTLQTGVDDAESYYTKSDPAGGRAIKVSLIGSGALILAGNVPLSTTLTNVADGVGNTSTLQLSTNQVRIGRVSNDTPLALFGSQNVNAIISTANISGSEKTFTFPNSTMTFAGINVAQTFTASQIISAAGAASTPALSLTGTWFTGGTTTTTKPQFLIEPTGTSSTNWSVNGTGLGLNASSGFTGNLLDLQINGQSSVRATIFGSTNFGTTGFVYTGSAVATNSGQDRAGNALRMAHNLGSSAGYGIHVLGVNGTMSWTSGVGGSLWLRDNFGAAAGTGSFRPLTIEYTINNSGAQTGNTTGIFLNATEGPVSPTSGLNGMAHNLLDLQVGGVSRFRVSNTGALSSLFVNGTGYFAAGVATTIGTAYGIQSNLNIVPPAGTASFRPYEILYTINTSGPQTGGATTTGIFLNATETALNGMGHTLMDLRTTDSIGVTTSRFKVSNGGLVNATTFAGNNSACNRYSDSSSGLINWAFVNSTTSAVVYQTTGLYSALSTDVINTSAIFELRSTTKGFLPPVMTTTQKNAISSPATGLVIFDSTLGKLCVYGGAAWQTVTSV